MAERKSVQIASSTIKAISFDIEPTLVCSKKQKDALWENILKEHFSSEFAHYCHQQFHQLRHKNYLKQCENGIYPTLDELYSMIMKNIIEENLLDIDQNEAMQILHDSMLIRPLHKDVSASVLTSLAIDVYVISLGSQKWLPSSILTLPVNEIYLTDERKCPKYHDVHSLFNLACSENNVKPSEWLHVSSQYSDLVYADKHGLKTCWLNRNGEYWNHLFRPDFEISSIESLMSIIEK